MRSRGFLYAVPVALGLSFALLTLRDGDALPAPTLTPDAVGAYGFHPGERVADFAYEGVQGGKGTLGRLLEAKEAVVVAMRTVECPVSRRYGHRLAQLEEEYAEKGVAFLWLDVSPQDTPEKIREDLETYGFDGPFVADPEGLIGAILQARVSTEVFVIDRARTLRYRGAVDDQYGITFSNPAVDETWLRDALDAVLAGRDVEVAETEASGCFLEVATALVPEQPLSYHGRVSRIVQENCVGCHREGGVAPMALDSYEQLHGFRHMVQFVLEEERMPPWFAAPGHGEWKNDRRLSERDRRDLLGWIAAGAPEGDAAAAPLPRAFVDGWQLPTEPDMVIPIPDEQVIPPDGVLDYRYVYVETDFDADLWVSGFQLQPTALEQTHHIIVYLEDPDDERRGPFLAGWAPGMPPTLYPEGAAKRIPKGATLMFELHYTPNGRPGTDRSMLGLVLAPGGGAKPVETSAVTTSRFEIPPHAPDHVVTAEMTFQRGGTLLMLLPHMHLRGKAFRYELVRDDGSEEILLDVPRYDFNWQLWYEFAEPLRVEAGWKLRGTARYDNSEANPANPDPTVAVTYGEQSFEEMMFGFFDWMPDPERARPSADGDGER